MDRTELTVPGDGATDLPSALAGCENDGQLDETTLRGTVVAGGRAAGLARDDLDAEGEARGAVARRLREFCRARDLELAESSSEE